MKFPELNDTQSYLKPEAVAKTALLKTYVAHNGTCGAADYAFAVIFSKENSGTYTVVSDFEDYAPTQDRLLRVASSGRVLVEAVNKILNWKGGDLEFECEDYFFYAWLIRPFKYRVKVFTGSELISDTSFTTYDKAWEAVDRCVADFKAVDKEFPPLRKVEGEELAVTYGGLTAILSRIDS